MNRKEFIGYEYKEIIADVDKISFLIDGYENFGWEPDRNFMEPDIAAVHTVHSPVPHRSGRTAVVRMKRNRKIMNKMELTRLQRNFEACIKEIETLERSKTSLPTMYALIIGFLGTVFMAGSVFAVTAATPHILLCVILAIPAFLGWLLPYFVFRGMTQRQIEKVTPYIEAKYDEICEICEKGNKLLL